METVSPKKWVTSVCPHVIHLDTYSEHLSKLPSTEHYFNLLTTRDVVLGTIIVTMLPIEPGFIFHICCVVVLEFVVTSGNQICLFSYHNMILSVNCLLEECMFFSWGVDVFITGLELVPIMITTLFSRELIQNMINGRQLPISVSSKHSLAITFELSCFHAFPARLWLSKIRLLIYMHICVCVCNAMVFY